MPDELKHFQLATGLASKSLVKGRFTLKADHYDQLIDSPFELADQTRFSFETHGIEHEFVISGTHATNVDRLKRILKKFVQPKLICLVRHRLKLYLHDYGDRE